MKRLIPLLLLLAACHGDKKFNQVKKGMSAKEVLNLVGEPDAKTPMLFAQWWTYKGDNKLIVLQNDTVVNVVQDLKASTDSMKSMGDAMSKMSEKMDASGDSLKKSMDEAGKAFGDSTSK